MQPLSNEERDYYLNLLFSVGQMSGSFEEENESPAGSQSETIWADLSTLGRDSVNDDGAHPGHKTGDFCEAKHTDTCLSDLSEGLQCAALCGAECFPLLDACAGPDMRMRTKKLFCTAAQRSAQAVLDALPAGSPRSDSPCQRSQPAAWFQPDQWSRTSSDPFSTSSSASSSFSSSSREPSVAPGPGIVVASRNGRRRYAVRPQHPAPPTPTPPPRPAHVHGSRTDAPCRSDRRGPRSQGALKSPAEPLSRGSAAQREDATDRGGPREARGAAAAGGALLLEGSAFADEAMAAVAMAGSALPYNFAG
jgi:hypothetical protein